MTGRKGTGKSRPQEESFPADFIAVLAAMKVADVTERQLAPDVLIAIKQCVGRYVRFCRASGIPVDMSSDSLHAYLKHIAQLPITSISRADYIQFFAYFARKYGVLDADLDKMDRVKRYFRRAGKKEPTRKSQRLAEHPMTLHRIFELATAEMEKGLHAPSAYQRACFFFRAALCALLSREPMRRKDVAALVIGETIVLNGSRWSFDFRSSKTGYLTLVDLPECLDVFIDFLLDASGQMDRQTIYATFYGRALFSSNGISVSERSTIDKNFKRVVGHSCHIVRTLTHVELAQANFPGEHALALCGQALSGSSREAYEIGVVPYRIRLAMETMDNIRAAKGDRQA